MGFHANCCLTAALLLCACRREESEQRQGPSGASPASSLAARAPGSSSAASASSAAAKATSEPEIRELLARWLDAQNRADFAAYEVLYAKVFEGTKRVGAQSFRFNRARWLLDRKGMFSHAPKVSVSSVTIVDLRETAVVRFEQSFESGKFRDVGQKQLTLTREGDKFAIAREEMLTSFQASPSGVLAFPELALLEQHAERSFVLLERSNLPPAAPELVDFELAVSAVADESALPENRRGLVGRELTLYGERGPACRVKVRRLLLAARAVPHEGQEAAWRGEGEEPAPPKPTIARELFALAGVEGRSLSLELEPNAACKGAFYARAADQPALDSFQRRAASVAERRAALAAFKGLPLYARNQRAFALDGNQGEWTNFEGKKPDVNVFAGTSGSWLSVSSQVGHGCAEYSGQGFALFRLQPDGRLELATDRSATSWFVPRAVLDANGDGVPELVGSELRLLQRLNDKFGLTLDLAPPVFACGC